MTKKKKIRTPPSKNHSYVTDNTSVTYLKENALQDPSVFKTFNYLCFYIQN